VRNKHATAELYPHGTTAHTTSIGGRPRRGSSRHKHHTVVAMADFNSGGNDIERQCRIEADGIGEGSSGYVWRVAAQTETMRIASRTLTGKKTPHAATAVVAAALKPALRTVKANAKRLGKKRSKKRKSAAR
jgi:hypothetical protein